MKAAGQAEWGWRRGVVVWVCVRVWELGDRKPGQVCVSVCACAALSVRGGVGVNGEEVWVCLCLCACVCKIGRAHV